MNRHSLHPDGCLGTTIYDHNGPQRRDGAHHCAHCATAKQQTKLKNGNLLVEDDKASTTTTTTKAFGDIDCQQAQRPSPFTAFILLVFYGFRPCSLLLTFSDVRVRRAGTVILSLPSRFSFPSRRCARHTGSYRVAAMLSCNTFTSATATVIRPGARHCETGNQDTQSSDSVGPFVSTREAPYRLCRSYWHLIGFLLAPPSLRQFRSFLSSFHLTHLLSLSPSLSLSLSLSLSVALSLLLSLPLTLSLSVALSLFLFVSTPA